MKKIPNSKFLLFSSTFFIKYRSAKQAHKNAQTTALMEPITNDTANHCKNNYNAAGKAIVPKQTKTSWMLCFRGPIKDDRFDHVVPESVVFDLSE